MKIFVDGKEVSITGHTHDDRYYTESEVDNKLKEMPKIVVSPTEPQGLNPGDWWYKDV